VSRTCRGELGRIGSLVLLLCAMLAGRGCLPLLSDALPDDDDDATGDDDTTAADDDDTTATDDDDSTAADDDSSDDDSGDDDTTGASFSRIEISVQGLVLDGTHSYSADVECGQVKKAFLISASDAAEPDNRISLSIAGEPIPGEFYDDSFVFSWQVDDWSVTAGPDGGGCSLEILAVEEPLTGRFSCAEMTATAPEQHEVLLLTDGGFVCP
jgi:hypothetical protein